VEGAGRITLGDEQRLSDLLNLSERFLALENATTEGIAPAARSTRGQVLLSKQVISLLVPVGRAQREESGRTRESMLVHKITSRLVVFLPGMSVRGAVHHVPGADLAQHLDLRFDTFIPLTEVYVTRHGAGQGARSASFRAGFALLNKARAVAFRLQGRETLLGVQRAAGVHAPDAGARPRLRAVR